MKNNLRDTVNLKRPQYSSRITATPSSTSNKSGQKLGYNRRGNSVEPYRDNNSKGAGNDHEISSDNEGVGLSGLIAQVPKGARPLTGNFMSYTGNNLSQNLGQQQNAAVNSPRPNTERLAYSLSPNRAQAKNFIKYLPPKSKQHTNKKTLVLDLDETLVHSGFKPFSNNSDIILKIELDNRIHDIHVLVRPGVEEFLDKMAKHYELVIFTASLSKYADPLVDKLDPKRLCVYRLFRQHCTEINRAFVKDLRKLDRDLKDLIILDNSPISFALNVENGMPIKNWYDDRSDRELYNLTQVLEFLAYVPDVRDYIKRMTEKNEISYSKAMNVMNSYNLNSQNDNYKNLSPHSPVMSSSQNKNKNIKDYIYKSINQGASPYSNSVDNNKNNINNNNNNISSSQHSNNNQGDDKESVRYSSNLTRDRSTNKGATSISNNNNPYTFNPHSNNLNPNSNANVNSNSNSNSHSNDKTKKDPNDKQNINIVLINNHINRYIINQQEALNNQRESNNSANLNADPMKKHKSINTFRSSNNSNQPPNQQYQQDVMLRSNNNYQSSYQNALNRSNNNIDNPQAQMSNYMHNKFNVKNLNVNTGAEVKSPVLKSSSSNSKGMTSNTNMGSSVSKYSSLIDTHHNNNQNQSQNQNQNSSRPSSAIIIKGRHNRDASANSYKSENVNQYAPITRSPSSQNVPQSLNRNNSKGGLNIKRETPRNNYLLSLETSKGGNTPSGNTPSGNKTMRPSSNQDRVRINYTTNLNPLSSMNNLNNIKIANRYEVDDLINRRGYSLSSRANDLKPQSYRFKESEVKYQTPSNKFSASGIYRSSVNTSKHK